MALDLVEDLVVAMMEVEIMVVSTLLLLLRKYFWSLKDGMQCSCCVKYHCFACVVTLYRIGVMDKLLLN